MPLPLPPADSTLARMAAWLATRRWPNRCAVCRGHTAGREAGLCGDCLARFSPPGLRCPRCACRLGVASPCGACLRDPPPWSQALAACDYAYPWDGLLVALKYRDALDLMPALALRLAEQVRFAALPAVDAVVPVPLADARLRERGYNQAALLAAAVSRRLALKFEPAWLLRVAATHRQTSLPRARRAANVRGAFAAEPLAQTAMRGRAVALVDDVMTTGATLAEASRVLLQAGCSDVQVWVVARTPH